MSWLTGYTYRKKVTITGQAGVGNNYQVKLQIGNISGGDFNLSGHAASFPNDIRFTSNNGSTQLDYWIENVATAPITVWIKVADSLNSNVDIYCYYGKASDTTTSSGTNTFEVFDDFNGSTLDTSKWSISGGTTSLSGGILTYTISGAYHSIRSILGFNSNVAFRIREKNTTNGSGWHHLLGFLDNYETQNILINSAYNANGQTTLYAHDSTSSDRQNIAYTWGSYSISEVTWTSGVAKAYQNNTYLGTLSFHIPTTSLQAAITGDDEKHEVDWILVRKYASPEPTFSTADSEELGITAYSMSLHPSETPCRTGICTIRADITWQNLGSSSITFRPTIIIDGTTYVQAASDITIGTSPNTGSSSITTPTLSVGTHTICPYPN